MTDHFIAGQLVDSDGRPYFTEDAVSADGYSLNNNKFRSDGYRYVTLDAISNGNFINKILYAPDGAMGVTTDAVDSASNFNGQFMVNSAGRVHIQDGGTVSAFVAGIGLTTTGAVATAGTVGGNARIWDEASATNDRIWDESDLTSERIWSE